MKSKSHIYMLLMGLFFSVSSCDYLAVSDIDAVGFQISL